MGPLEGQQYVQLNLDKFAALTGVVFRYEDVTIYKQRK